jgi:hypothetical protein
MFLTFHFHGLQTRLEVFGVTLDLPALGALVCRLLPEQ